MLIRVVLSRCAVTDKVSDHRRHFTANKRELSVSIDPVSTRLGERLGVRFTERSDYYSSNHYTQKGCCLPEPKHQ